MVGDQVVYRQRRGKTIVSVAPVASSVPPTAAQTAQRQVFRRAARYAHGQALDPAVQALYGPVAKERELSVYHVVMADAMHAPHIEQIDLTGYRGAVGNTIQVVATDDFAVTQVTVTIEKADGTVVETGNAVQQADPNQWVFTATVRNTPLTGVKVTILAADRPGNLDQAEQIL